MSEAFFTFVHGGVDEICVTFLSIHMDVRMIFKTTYKYYDEAYRCAIFEQ